MSTTLLLGGGALMLFVFLIIIFAVVIYFLTRPEKESEKEKETDESPTISGAGVELVLNPDEETDEVEKYMIKEYAIGETTAKNIDVKLKWKNGPGFTSVEKLIFVQKVNETTVRADVITTDNVSPNTEYEIVLLGKNLTSDNIVGENTIEMYWNTKGSSNLLETIKFDIKDEHLDSTLDISQAQNITVATRLASGTTSTGSVITTYTKYHILPFFQEPVYIRKVGNDDGFNIIKGGVKETIDGVEVFYIKKALGRTFLSKDAAGNSLMNVQGGFVNNDELFKSDEQMDMSNISVKELSPDEDFKYEFTVQHADNHSSHDAHIHFVELYDYNYNFIKRVTNYDIEFHKPPDHVGNANDYLGAWKQGSAPKNTKLFTIKSTKAAGRLHIMYGRPCYVPGWSIKENGENIWEDKENGGPDLEPKHLIYSYDIKKETPREFFKIGNAPLIPIGSTVKCKTNDIGNSNSNVWRLVTPNQLNWYPDSEIANYWDSNWDKNIKMIEDCEGYTRGSNLSKSEPDSYGNTLEYRTPYSINHRHNIYMERQHVDCKDHAMRGFHLIPNWNCDDDTTCKSEVGQNDRNASIKHQGKSTAIRYHYKCDAKKQPTITQKETETVSNPDISKTYAFGQSDKLNVNCGNKPITYYELHTDQNDDWSLKYKYNCGSTTSDKCRNITTDPTDASDNWGFLDRQNVECKENEYLSQFKLKSTGKNGKNNYEYKCCEIPAQTHTQTPELTQIPHQIPSGTDGWCWNDGKTVHQDVPGCGRICSSWEYVGRKDKDSWGLWGDNQNNIDCPAAKLDQVWKLTGGSTNDRLNREVAVGAFSG